MSELKTKKTELSVNKFLDTIADADRKKTSLAVLKLMKEVTKSEPKMWGTAIIGFGNHILKYDSGRELPWFPVGFSPRKGNLAVYLKGGVEKHKKALTKLGKHKTGKGCIYINKLEDVDLSVLKEMIKVSFGSV